MYVIFLITSFNKRGVDTAKCKQSSSKLKLTSNNSSNSSYPVLPSRSTFKRVSMRPIANSGGSNCSSIAFDYKVNKQTMRFIKTMQ